MITVERAKSEDVDSIKRVLSETWMDTYADHLPRSTIEYVTTNWHDPNMLRSQIENPGDYFAVAKDEGNVTGLVTVVSVGQNELYLTRLYVHPQHQRRGIGTDLLNAALAAYPDAKTIRLEVEQHNTKGLSFWRKQKFVEVGTRIEQIGTDRMAVITMERRLK